jgi:chromosome segregation ATPase
MKAKLFDGSFVDLLLSFKELDETRKRYEQQSRSLNEQIDYYKSQIHELTSKLSGLEELHSNPSVHSSDLIRKLQRELEDQKRSMFKRMYKSLFLFLMI